VEEIYQNKDDFTMAAKGRGTRVGLRGQAGRLDLDGFLQYIWAPKDCDDLPPMADYYEWPIDITEGHAYQKTHTKITNAINSVRSKVRLL
jgi:hypothetical protein